MTRSEILDTAKQYVTNDRASTHGEPENSFADIAALWNAYFGKRLKSCPIMPYEIGALMALFKIARARGNPSHTDNWIDGAGYLACGGELSSPHVENAIPDGEVVGPFVVIRD